jgi:integrase
MRKDRWQPVPQPVADARWVAYGWRTSFAYAGSYVLFRPALAVREYDGRADKGRWHTSARRAGRAAAAADQPWSYAAFNRALHAAEARAGVARQDFRAAHGFRRHVLTLLLELTGDSVFAGAYIGDTDLGVLRRSYVRETEDHSREAADLLTGAAAAGPPAAPPAARNRGRTTTAARGGAAVEEEPST